MSLAAFSNSVSPSLPPPGQYESLSVVHLFGSTQLNMHSFAGWMSTLSNALTAPVTAVALMFVVRCAVRQCVQQCVQR